MSMSERGFGSLTPERRKEIASKGGKSAHEKGKAYEWNSETARLAGAKGGKITKDGKAKLDNTNDGKIE